jgi:hypothetical protein
MTTKEIVEYVWKHRGMVYHKSSKEKVERWVTWAVSHGFVLSVVNDDETLAGIAIIRPVMSPEDSKVECGFDPEGSCLSIDAVIATGKGALAALGFATLKRFGMRETVCWQRPPYYVLETHKAATLRRNLFRTGVTHYG